MLIQSSVLLFRKISLSLRVRRERFRLEASWPFCHRAYTQLAFEVVTNGSAFRVIIRLTSFRSFCKKLGESRPRCFREGTLKINCSAFWHVCARWPLLVLISDGVVTIFDIIGYCSLVTPQCHNLNTGFGSWFHPLFVRCVIILSYFNLILQILGHVP